MYFAFFDVLKNDIVQDPIPEEQIHDDEESDGDSDLSAMRIRVARVVESRRLVLALPSVPLTSLVASPVRLAPVQDVDRIAGGTYMRNYYVRMKAKRLQDRAHARLAPRRSPRLASKSI